MRVDVTGQHSGPVAACVAALIALVGWMVVVPAARAADFTHPTFTEFTGGGASGLSANGGPASVRPGPDGNLWMAETQGAGRIAKVTPAGVVTEFTGGVTPHLTAGRGPANLVAGPDANVWVTEFNDPGGVVRITPAGVATEFDATGNSNPTGITVGPGGDLWFTEYTNPGRITKITTGGIRTLVATGGVTAGFSGNSQPRGIALGPDGNVWFTEFAGPGRIGRITPGGTVTEFTGGVTPGFSANSQPVDITPGPDGNLWFTEQGAGGRIGRITPAGDVTEFSAPTPGRQPALITSGPDGNLWFTEQAGSGGIGRITTAGNVTEFSAGSTPGFTADRAPTGITTGPDGNIWFTESGDPGAIVRVAPGPGAPAPTPAPGPAPEPAPQVTAVTAAAPLVAGSSALLSAHVQGAAQHLDWDLNGDGKPEVSCPGDQTTLGFRPSAAAGAARAAGAAGGRVSVTAVGAAGTGAALTQTFAVAPAAPVAGSKTLKNAVARVITREPAVYSCGRGEDFAAAADQLSHPANAVVKCLGWTIIAGTLHVTGCLLPVHQLADIPQAERGVVQGLVRAVGVQSTKSSTVLTTANRVLGQFDGWVSTGPVLVNGVELNPGSKASIVVLSQVDQIVSSDAALTVGGIALQHRKDFSMDTRPANANAIPLGDFPRLPGPIAGLGAFAMVGDLKVTLVPAAPGGQAGSEISTELKLPSFLNIGGGEARTRVTLHVTAGGKLVLEDMHIKLPDVWIGGLETKDLQLDFAHEGADSVWRGQGKLCVTEVACLNALEEPGKTPPGGFVIRNGELERAFVNLEFPDPGIALYPNVYLKSVGAGVGLDPTRVFGAVGVKAIGIYKIDGRLVLAFPSAATPFRLSRDEIGGLTEQDYSHPYSRFTLAASGEASLQIPALDKSFRLGGAYFVYEAPGYVHVGGDVEESFAGIVKLTGRTNGEFNLANGRFNFGQDIQACVLDYFCRGSATRLSSVGVGACATFDLGVGSISIGGGVRFAPLDIRVWPLDGCRWTAFEDAHVFDARSAPAATRVRAAQATGTVVVTIKKGDRSRAIRLDGAEGAPLVRVTAPGGQVLDSPDGPGTALTPAIRILRSQQIKATVVGLQDPKPGSYRIDPMPGSPAITTVSEATDPLLPRVTARVRGRGAHRTLVYDVRRRPNQRVTFVDSGPGGDRPIGTIAGGRGTLTFSPAPATGRRRIKAQFELAGVGAERKTVATFTPPSVRLGRPAHLTVRRRANRLLLAWTRVAGATRYEIVTTLTSGVQRIARTRRASATISPVARASGGRVTVRAIAPMRQGRATAAPFRASGPRTSTRFGPLPRLKRATGG
jgi:streptogramin lyase